jgi:hypothetical protein
VIWFWIGSHDNYERLDIRECSSRIKALVRGDNEAMLADPEGVSS